VNASTAGGAQVATVALSNLRSIPPIAGVRAANPMLGDYNATGGTIAEAATQSSPARSPRPVAVGGKVRLAARHPSLIF